MQIHRQNTTGSFLCKQAYWYNFSHCQQGINFELMVSLWWWWWTWIMSERPLTRINHDSEVQFFLNASLHGLINQISKATEFIYPLHVYIKYNQWAESPLFAEQTDLLHLAKSVLSISMKYTWQPRSLINLSQSKINYFK